MPIGVLRTSACVAYCTHAYALSQTRAANFFEDVFCHNGTSECGRECEARPCFMDWAMTRYLKRSGGAWIVGGGLRSPWNVGHRGVFIQNRSAVLGNSVSDTALHSNFQWSNDSALVEEERCKRHKNVADALVRRDGPLPSVLAAVKWSGRLGNLLFQLAALVALQQRLQATSPTRVVGFEMPASLEVPVNEMMEQFPLIKQMLRIEPVAMLSGFDSAYASELAACKACKLVARERGANTYDDAMVRRIEAWAASPPRECSFGLIELRGYFQSFRYFDRGMDATLLSLLAVPASATASEADGILGSVRRGLPLDPVAAPDEWKLVGVQVRLGDKVTSSYFQKLYAPTSWAYYRIAMQEVRNRLLARGAKKVAFVVTAGGSMGNNSADAAEARQYLSADNVFFSSAANPYVDLAVLRRCDGLVISSSTFGWWAAWLARLSAELVMAPREIFHLGLSRWHPLRQGYRRADYFPPEWCLLDNEGNSTARLAATDCLKSNATRRRHSTMHTNATLARTSPSPHRTTKKPAQASKLRNATTTKLNTTTTKPRSATTTSKSSSKPMPTIGACHLRILGTCTYAQYNRPQYRSWWPASAGVVTREACAKKQRIWQQQCGGAAASIEAVLK